MKVFNVVTLAKYYDLTEGAKDNPLYSLSDHFWNASPNLFSTYEGALAFVQKTADEGADNYLKHYPTDTEVVRKMRNLTIIRGAKDTIARKRDPNKWYVESEAHDENDPLAIISEITLDSDTHVNRALLNCKNDGVPYTYYTSNLGWDDGVAPNEFTQCGETFKLQGGNRDIEGGPFVSWLYHSDQRTVFVINDTNR